MKGVLYRIAVWCPGAVGLWLRQKMLPRYFFSCGKGVLFGRLVKITTPEKIMLGDRVVLNNQAVLDAGHSANDQPVIVLEDDVFIGTGTRLLSRNSGSIVIRSGANFSSSCLILAESRMEIGKNVLVAAYSTLGEKPDQYMEQKNEKDIPAQEKETRIGDNCWLGVRVHVNEGISVGSDTIVGAHAVVESDLPSYAVAVGKPARVIKDRRKEN